MISTIKNILFLLSFFYSQVMYAQPSPALIYQQYQTADGTAAKVKVMNDYFENFRGTEPEFAIPSLLKTENYFSKQNDDRGAGMLQLLLAQIFDLMGEYSSALRYSIPALHNFERVADTSQMITLSEQIGSSYLGSENIRQGLHYYLQSLALAKVSFKQERYAIICNDVAVCYNRLNLPDSALPFINRAIGIKEKLQDLSGISAFYATLGESYLVMNAPEQALPYFRKSIEFEDSSTSPKISASILSDIAEAYYKLGQYDSVILYGNKAAYDAYPHYKKQLMNGLVWIYKAFDKTGMKDSANYYFRVAATVKDSIFTTEKDRNLQEIKFQEDLRLQEIETERLKLAAERKENITFSLIGLGIVAGITLFLLLSRWFIINEKIIKALGIVILLFAFEFFNLWLHPFLEKLTGHSPLYMLISLVCIAALLTPIHHKAEKWAVNILVEKNKELQLVADKKGMKKNV
ncbi:MAG: hypothetical protein ABIP30_07855 [Ferruginibacter sp.]